MLKQRVNRFIGIIFVLGLCAPSLLFAQTRPSITLKVTPENYGPKEKVTISLSSFNIDLDTSENVWTVSGSLFKKGVGVKEIEITTPESDAKLEVKVSVVQNGSKSESVLVLNPTSIDLFFESLDGYVPAWYLGRSQVAEESVAKVVAVPNSFKAIYSQDDKTYTWSKNNFKDAGQSGRGRQVFVTKLSPFSNSESISLEVGGTSKKITLAPKNTIVSMYEKSPLVGTRFENELAKNLTLTRDNVTFEVVPWFFSALNRASDLVTMTWTVNGLPTKTDNKTLLNLRKTPDQKGKAVVGVSVKHKERTLQNNRSTINIDI